MEMPLIKIEPGLKDIINVLGPDPDIEAIKIFNMGLKELLRECEEEIMKLEIKYGMSYEEFKTKFFRISEDDSPLFPPPIPDREEAAPRCGYRPCPAGDLIFGSGGSGFAMGFTCIPFFY